MCIRDRNSTPENLSEMEKHLDNYKRSLKKSRDLNKAIAALQEKMRDVYNELDRINQMTPDEKSVRRRLMQEYDRVRLSLPHGGQLPECWIVCRLRNQW